MITQERRTALSHYLFANEETNVYAVLDGASVKELLPKLDEHQPPHICLFPGDLEPDMAEVAPYLIKLIEGGEFTNWVLEQGWGNHWGVFAATTADIYAMRQHLRRLLTVYDENGRPLRFRYYDPRVMRKYLPVCNTSEVNEFFGPVENYLMEAEDDLYLLSLSNNNGALTEQKVKLNQVF